MWSQGRVAGRAVRALLAVLGAMAVLAPTASGHASLLESTPAPGERLTAPPEQVTLRFTEPLIPKLTTASLVDVDSGDRVEANTRAGEERQLILTPARELNRGAYRVDWHTVSTEDGHALEGSFGFGVGADAVGGVQNVEQSPLARGGWLRIGLRAVFYAGLVLFAGGVFAGVLLGRAGEPAAWLAPPAIAHALQQAGVVRTRITGLAWRRTIAAGWLAAAAGVAMTLTEAADASGGFTLDGARSFLLTNMAGVGRVGAVVAIAAAALLATRRAVAAGALLILAFLSIALSGHANSADPRAIAVGTDWIHLIAGSVWIGGIAQIGMAWLPQLRRAPTPVRREVMRTVLSRFGALAAPAFVVVALTGLANALIQLGRPGALVDTAYGLVLTGKIALVGLIAAASYWHAVRLRPRLLAAQSDPSRRVERRHWGLLRAEAVTGLAVIAAAALLVAFPLPPRQLAEAGQTETAEVGQTETAQPAGACNPCPQPKPRSDELAVAENAGSTLVAAWIRRVPGGLAGEIRLFGLNFVPERRPARIAGAHQQPCGNGCLRFRIDGRPASIEVRMREDGRPYTARLPARWRKDGAARARRILRRAERTMRALDTVRQYESINSGPGTFVIRRYRFQAPNRFAYTVEGSGARSIVVEDRQWSKRGDTPKWEAGQFGGGRPFRTRRWFRWSRYARSVRLVDIRRTTGRRIAELALTDHATPVWYRLWVDLSTMRITRARMIANGHFMTHRFSGFNDPFKIQPPPPDDVR